MAYVADHVAAQRGAIAFVSRVRAAIDAYVRRRVAFAETLNELSALTDRDLADLGLRRCDLRRVAAEAAARV